MNELVYLKILYTTRENDNCISIKKLSDIFEPLGHYHKYDFRPLVTLIREGYILIVDSRNADLTEYVCSMHFHQLMEFFSQFMEPKHDDIYIKLTTKLSEIQSLLGFSLNDTIAKFSNGFSAIAKPFFGNPDPSLKADVFVIMPFREEFDYLYRAYIKKVCENLGLSCKRADDLYSSKPIIQDIWSLIYNSKVIIADCSTKNPNVMYELGIAHVIGKEVILITQDVDDIPFDLRHLRHLPYTYAPHSISNFENELINAIRSSHSLLG